jgi:hypothetical protein
MNLQENPKPWTKSLTHILIFNESSSSSSSYAMAPSSSLISFGQQKLITQFHLTKGSVSSSSSCSSSGDISLHDPPKLCGGVGLSSRRLSTAGTCSGTVLLVSRNGGRGFGWSSRSRWRLMKKNKRKPLQASSLECSRTGRVKEAQCSNRLHKLNLLSTVPRRILEEEEGCCCCSSADRRVVIAKNSSSKFFSEWPLRLMPNTEDSRSVGGIFSCSCTSAERDQETEHEEGMYAPPIPTTHCSLIRFYNVEWVFAAIRF